MPISKYDNFTEVQILDMMIVWENNIPSCVNIYRHIIGYHIGILEAATILSDYYNKCILNNNL